MRYTPSNKPIVFLDKWSVIVPSDSPYTSPEGLWVALSGKVYAHPRHINGKQVCTSILVESKGREVETTNTHYVLGKMDEGYEKWLESEGIDIDFLNPVKIKKTP